MNCNYLNILILFMFVYFQPVYAAPSIWENNPAAKVTAKKFIGALKKHKKIAGYFDSKFEFIFHDDNRCDGDTDGVALAVLNTNIDKIVNIDVIKTGKGWACKNKKGKNYTLKFDFHGYVKESFETMSENYNKEKLMIYITGNYDTVWFTFHFKKVNDKYLIYKMKYESQDPG